MLDVRKIKVEAQHSTEICFFSHQERKVRQARAVLDRRDLLARTDNPGRRARTVDRD